MLGRSWIVRQTALLAVGTALTACIPEGPATVDAGAAPQKPAAPATPRASAKPVAPHASASAAASASALPVLTAAWEDTFDRADLGPDWNARSPAWKITNGRLCARGARNKGAWLAKRLPTNARIEFEAYAESSEGDLKIELWGDGQSGATGTSYTNATSYIAILGGWKNTKHVLARRNEHGDDRLEIDVDPQSDDERMRAIAAGQAYHFKIERADDKTVQISINGTVYFELADREPLSGAGHEHFGFNDWDAPVCFDNLKVTPL
ncbi:Hypothetical protein A7982_11223 [Minicystis rosea]|nr:Hypothetical protein A7982_11223 [Minicystis rosea]